MPPVEELKGGWLLIDRIAPIVSAFKSRGTWPHSGKAGGLNGSTQHLPKVLVGA